MIRSAQTTVAGPASSPLARPRGVGRSPQGRRGAFAVPFERRGAPTERPSRPPIGSATSRSVRVSTAAALRCEPITPSHSSSGRSPRPPCSSASSTNSPNVSTRTNRSGCPPTRAATCDASIVSTRSAASTTASSTLRERCSDRSRPSRTSLRLPPGRRGRQGVPRSPPNPVSRRCRDGARPGPAAPRPWANDRRWRCTPPARWSWAAHASDRRPGRPRGSVSRSRAERCSCGS